MTEEENNVVFRCSTENRIPSALYVRTKYLPPGTFEKLAALAEKNHTSINKTLIRIITEATNEK